MNLGFKIAFSIVFVLGAGVMLTLVHLGLCATINQFKPRPCPPPVLKPDPTRWPDETHKFIDELYSV